MSAPTPAPAPKHDVPFAKELEVRQGSDESPIVQVVDKLFEMALRYRASDIHLEPQADGLFVRLRVDGVLQTVHRFSKSESVPLVSRIKILANLDIAEKRLPQDGQISTKVQGRDIDLRVSTLPAKYGEKVVIRLLDKSGGLIEMSVLGMDPKTEGQFSMLIGKPQGLLLVTGPTGSGKSTTLYAAISRLKSPMKNIITLEDPIEYELLGTGANQAGITQVQVNSRINLTFAAGLRACLRQDPDVIMLGEIRDKETAEVAMKAAMTGHLVVSTLHTNDAPSTITRLRDIGVEPYLVSSTLVGVMAQRLLRVLCKDCKEAYEPPRAGLQRLFPGMTLEDKVTLYRAKGCPSCQNTGYWGRKGIYQLLELDEEFRTSIHNESSADRIRQIAAERGVKTLRESGLDLVLKGLTTVEEVFRHTIE